MPVKLKISYGVDPDPVGGGFYWPASPSKRRELLTVKRNHPATYESTYQCRPGEREGSIFLERDFAYYSPPRGLSDGLANVEVIEFLSKFHTIIASWDTAFEATNEADHTVGIAAGLLPCERYHCGEDANVFGPCEPHLDVYLLDLTREKLAWGDLVSAIRRFHAKWRPSMHVVEKRGSGISLYQSLPQIGITVEGVMTTESKRARAVSGAEAGSVQGWFRQHRVLTPIGAPWLDTYKTEMKDFTGDDDSSDDQVDCTVHLVNYAIQTGGHMALMPSAWTPDRLTPNEDALEDMSDLGLLSPRQTSRAAFMNWLNIIPQSSVNPFGDTCSACAHAPDGYCTVQRRKVAALDSCEHFFDANTVPV